MLHLPYVLKLMVAAFIVSIVGIVCAAIYFTLYALEYFDE